MRPPTPVGRVHKYLRIHLHVEPTVCHPPTGKHQRMGFIGLDDAKLEILIKRGARNRLPLVHGAVSAINETMEPNPAGGLAIYQSVDPFGPGAAPTPRRNEAPPARRTAHFAGRGRPSDERLD